MELDEDGVAAQDRTGWSRGCGVQQGLIQAEVSRRDVTATYNARTESANSNSFELTIADIT